VQTLGLDRGSHDDSRGGPAPLQQLSREQHRPQGRVESPRGVEERRVAAIQEHGHHVCAGGKRKTPDCRMPRRVEECFDIKPASPRDFARWKNDERLSLTQPEMRSAKTRLIPGNRRAASEGIDEEARLPELGDPRENVVGQHAYIGSDLAHGFEKHETVRGASRVVGRHDQRA